jgi:hypothetical protein
MKLSHAACVAALLSSLVSSASTASAATRPPRDRDAPPAHDADAREADAFRAGVLGGVGFPRPLAIEVLGKIDRTLALGFEYSVLPTTTISDVRTSFWALALDARLFPMRGPFFVGARAGRQHLAGTTTVSDPSLGSATESVSVDTWFVNPRVGFLWTWQTGLTLGIDAGLQIPLSASESSSVPAAAAGIPAADSATSVASTLGKHVLPTVDLLEVGFLF